MMETNSRSSFGWQRVDESADPAFHVRFLEERARDPDWQRRISRQAGLLDLVPGVRLLDVGCGIGNELRFLAPSLSADSRAVGIDRSEDMITAARQRAQGLMPPLEFEVGDIYALHFESDLFDRCRASALFLHLDDPVAALHELVRVTAPGGLVLVSEPDFETWQVDLPDRELTRRLVRFIADSQRDGWIGRKLPRLFKQAGLSDIVVTPDVLTATNRQLGGPGHLSVAIKNAVAGGALTADEAAWINTTIDEAVEAGTYFAAVTSYIVTGRKRKAFE